MPLVRAPGRSGVPLRRPSPRRGAEGSGRRRHLVPLPLLPRQSGRTVYRALGACLGLPAMVQPDPRYREPRDLRGLPAGPAAAGPGVRRLATGGRIDRDRPLPFRWDGRELSGYAGDTLASALLGAGITVIG